ncbi:MAG TPA: metallophosphoesterase [Opitutaceae bacterium]|jgi:Icc-related predicted phosphoesterase
MRILHVTDFHGSDPLFDWLSQASKGFDLVAFSGDLLDLNQHRPVGGQIDRVLAHLKRILVPTAIVSGNHDSVAGRGSQLELAQWLKEAKREGVWIDGDAFELGGQSFRCIPWNRALPDALPGEIWLIHAPPDEAATGISRGGAGWGSFDFGELCRSKKGPRLALSGHVHDPQSWRAKVGATWSLNPGRTDDSATPNHIVIDLSRGVVARNQASDDTDFLKL